MSRYLRPHLKTFKPYVPGEQPRDAGKLIKLNTNELPYPPSPRIAEFLQSFDYGKLARYPDPRATELCAAWARRFGYPDHTWALAGNGMDELLMLSLRAFCDPGDVVTAAYPSYSLYETIAELHQCVLEYHDLTREWTLPESIFTARGKVCFLTRPNAPSGVPCPRAEVERLVESFDGIVVVDEAYCDFAAEDCTDLPRRYDNAIVMRTLSKSYGLAGLRVGLLLAQPELVRAIAGVKDIYNVDVLAQSIATIAIEDDAYFRECVGRVVASRDTLAEGLRALGFDVPASQTNFVLACSPPGVDAHALLTGLRARGIIVRYFNHRGLENALRITVGTEEECAQVLFALRELLS